MSEENFKIRNGTKIAVIGGGPAGTSFTIRLLKESAKRGLKPRVIIFEPKDFMVHYNQCVGVLSPPSEELFVNILGIPFPSHLIKREINGYAVYTDRNSTFKIMQKSGTYATRRILFDRFMLDKAKEFGAEVINSRVTGIEFYNGNEVRVYSEGKFLRVDAVVGAFGLDEGAGEIFENSSRLTFRYRRPGKALETIITKIHVDREVIEYKLQSLIHAFLLNNQRRIEFGAITPKGDHIIINIAGRGVTSQDMDRFLSQPAVKKILGEQDFKTLDYFKGRYPIKPAKGIIGDRFVAVGDATGWIRPYKGKGINVAIETGAKAAEIMLNHGFSREDLRKYVEYFRPLQDDYIYGKIFRTLVLFSLKTGFMDEILSFSENNENLREGIYMAVSGEGKYSEILKKFFATREIIILSKKLIKYLIRKLF